MIPLPMYAGVLALQLVAAPAEAEAGAPLELTAPLPAATSAPAPSRWSGAAARLEQVATTAEQAAGRSDPTALGHLYRLWNLQWLVEDAERVNASLERIRREKRATPLVRAHATHLAAQLARRRGDLDGAHALAREIGLLDRAVLIGPFDNAAGRGHDESYPPESGEGFDEPVPGKATLVSWREVTALAAHGAFELASLVHPASEATAYVAAVIEVPARTNAALRTGAADQLRAFVNGVEVLAVDSRRGAALDQDAAPIVLEKGKNLLLLKSSWVEENGRLLARITDPEGRPIRGLQLHGDRAAVAAAFRALSAKQGKAAAPRHAVTTVSADLDRAVTRSVKGAKAEALALRADLRAVLELYDRRKLPTPPEEDLEAAIRLDPSSPDHRFFFAHRVDSRDPNLAHEQLREALTADPGHVLALFKLADMAKNGGRLLEANERLEQALSADPTFVHAHVARAALGFDDLGEGAVALFRLAEAPGTSASPSALLEVARMRRALGDNAGARADAERVLALDADRHLARHMALELALQAGDGEAGLAHAEAQVRFRPWSVAQHTRLARILSGIGGREPEALASLAVAESLFPDAPAVPRLAAELFLFGGDRARAIAALDRTLAIDPHQPEVRRHRGHLAGGRRDLEDEHTIDAGSLVEAPVSDEERRFGAIYLADRSAVQLYGDGKSVRFKQYAIRLRNPRLADALRVQRVFYSPSREVVEILSAERIKKNGEVVKATNIGDDGPRGKISGMYVDQRFKVIVFDQLEEGDLVHVRYRVDSAGHNMFGGFFGDIEPLETMIPKRGVVYTAIAPEKTPLYPAGVGIGGAQVAKAGDLATYSWSFEQLGGLEVEPFAPPYPAIGKMVSVSTYQSWEELGRWYARLYADQMELDAAAREAGRRVVAGAKSEAEKIQRLYDYVVKNTRYVGIELGIHGWKPFKASEVHRRRYGDCKDKSTLLAALLRDNGIDAARTLVGTPDRGGGPGSHATQWAVNHPITYVPSANLFLDPTAEFSGTTELPHQDQGAMALVVHPDGATRLTRLPVSKAEDNMNRSSYVARINEATELELSGTERFYGARASALRHELQEEEQRKTLIERQLGQVFAGARVSEIAFSDMTDLEQPVEYTYRASIPRYGQVENGRWVIPVALYQHQVASAYAQLAKRRHSLFVPHAWSTQNVIRYELPEGAQIEVLPEGVTIETKHISLKQIVRRVEGGFETDDTVTLSSREIPAEDYEAFRATALAIDRAMARKVVIKW